ncbi:MAG: hypothetical protein AAF264_05775 [Pseudomonadota bacterium]
MKDRTAIDGHVHLYGGMDPARALIAGFDNLSAASGGATDICLLLTETSQDDAFGLLAAGRMAVHGWTVRALPEDPSALLATDGRDRRVFLIAGRQIVTREGIEVLALATTGRHADGRSVDTVLLDLRASGTPSVLPWGLGKWLGERGRRVASLIEADRDHPLLGDNAGRPPGWPDRNLFRETGPVVIPGTDPLPLPGSETQIGCYGFVLEGRLDEKQPARDLAARLFALRSQPDVIGTRRGVLTVLREQAALRLRKASRR